MTLSNTSIRNQLLVLVGGFMLLLIALSTAALWTLWRANDRLVEMYHERLVLVEDLQAVSGMYGFRIVDSVHKVQHRALSPKAALDNVRTAQSTINKHWRLYMGHDLTEAERDLAAEAETLMGMADVQLAQLKTLLMTQDQQGIAAFSVRDLYVAVDPITAVLGQLVAFQQTQSRSLFETSQAEYQLMRNTILGLLLVLGVVGMGMGVVVVAGVRRPLAQAQRAAQRIAEGDLSQAIAADGNNEFGQLLSALSVMQAKLVEQDDQRWVKSHVSEITPLLQQADTHTELGKVLLSRLAPLVGAGHAVFYVMNPDQRLQLLSAYGYQERKELKSLYSIGEGLIGQCALERTPITLSDPPPDYVRINSGLGDGVPACIVLLPVLSLDQVLGVLELAAFHVPTPRELALLEAVLPMMALNLEILQRKMRTQRLLEETQDQALRMEKQAAQLEEQAVEMAAQQAELMDTEAWYRSIVESAPEGLLVADEAGHIILCNARLEQVFGYEHGELLGQKVEVLVPDDVRASHPDKRRRFMASEGYPMLVANRMLRGRRKNGEVFAADFGLSLLPTRGSRGACVAVSVRELSAPQTQPA